MLRVKMSDTSQTNQLESPANEKVLSFSSSQSKAGLTSDPARLGPVSLCTARTGPGPTTVSVESYRRQQQRDNTSVTTPATTQVTCVRLSDNEIYFVDLKLLSNNVKLKV